MLVSPAEPAPLRAAGTVHAACEKMGVDVLCIAKGRRLGIQRKEVSDFLASVDDNRLAKELLQMSALDVSVLIVEGTWKYTPDGRLLTAGFGRSWTRTQIHGLLFSIYQRGVWVMATQNLTATIELVQDLEKWWQKGEHKAFTTRGGPKTIWGTKMDRDFAVWMLQSFPGIGPALAERVYDAVGFPFQLTVSVEELMKVEGMGKKKVEGILRVMGETDATA